MSYWEPSPEFYANEQKNASPPSPVDKFRVPNNDGKKCPVCSKTVYKAEEVTAIGTVWHQDCFTCGGGTEGGCKKKLLSGEYEVVDRTPYCNVCGDRVLRDSFAKVSAANLERSGRPEQSSEEQEDFVPAHSKGPPPTDFYSFELSSDFGKQKGSSVADKFRQPGAANKCPACDKTVYKAEELVALGSKWHVGCFTCGGSGGQGCKRKLVLGHFRVHAKHPYCDACGDRVSRESISKPANEGRTDGETNSSAAADEYRVDEDNKSPEFYQYELPSLGEKTVNRAIDKFTSPGALSSCPNCQRPVYKAEELIALGSTWHQSCFTCGTPGDQGCGRKLALGRFRVQDKLPYCDVCCDRLAKDKYSKPATVRSGVDAESESPPVSRVNTDAVDGFTSYQLNDDIGRESKSSKADFFRAAKDVNKCPACSKTVYKAEELVALGSTWHQSCFTCGGMSESGCKRRLMLGRFVVVSGNAYCDACHGRVAKEIVSKPTVLNTKGDTINRDSFMSDGTDGFQSFELSDDSTAKPKSAAADKFRAASNVAKCPSCDKTVYKAEEIQALGSTWHQSCFTCGGLSESGCKRRLMLGRFVVVSGNAYCDACHGRVAKEIVSKSAISSTNGVRAASGKTPPSDFSESESGNVRDSFHSYELPDMVGRPSQSVNKIAERFSVKVDSSMKCPICSDVVYKAELFVALGSNWHSNCFTCGAGSTDELGCRRKLAMGGFQSQGKTPYCDVCFNKVTMLSNSKNTPYTPNSAAAPAMYAAASPESDRKSFTQPYNGAQEDFVLNANEIDDEKAKKSSLRFQAAADAAPKCAVCCKTVFRNEAIQALGKSWHPSCFLCGGTGDQGCAKKLTAATFKGDSGNPYCDSCCDKLLKDSYRKSTSLFSPPTSEASNYSGFSGETKATKPPTVDQNFQSFELRDDVTQKSRPSAADKFRTLGADAAKKCPICEKNVYRAEEVIALNQSFHPSCFICGGKGDQGCRRRLAMGDFRGYNGDAYCNTCFDKVITNAYASKEVLSATTSKQSAPKKSIDPQSEYADAFGMQTENSRVVDTSEAATVPMDSAKTAVSDNNPSHDHEPNGSTIGQSEVTKIQVDAHESAPTNNSSIQVGDHTQDSNHCHKEGASMTTVHPPNGKLDCVIDGNTYKGIELVYESDFDENGAIFWIGSRGKSQPFENPVNNNLIEVLMSSVYKGKPSNIASRGLDCAPTYTGNDFDSFVEIDLGETRRMLPNYYTLRHGGSSRGNALRNWILEAKVKIDSDWILLRVHENDPSITIEPRSTASWPVNFVPPALSPEDFSAGFRYFRIFQTGPNSNSNDCLFLGGIEIYGLLFERV